MNLTANAIIEEFWDCKLPVDVSYFAERFGFTIKYEERGMGIRDGRLSVKDKTIQINPMVSDEAKRYAIARELGYYCLGYGDTRTETYDLKWIEKTTKEKERNVREFVADLLIPPLALKAMIDVRGIKNPIDLRQSFMVQSNLLYYQLKRYGYAKG